MNVLAFISVCVGVAGLIITIVTILVKLNTTITELSCAVKTFQKGLDALVDKNDKSHDQMWECLDAHDGTLANHETRITVIEKGRG